MALIERDGLVALLQKHFENVAAGEGHCIFISGEAGIGKTALVKTFCKEQGSNCTMYQGACDALFTPRPLAPLYDILWKVNKDRWPVPPSGEEHSTLFANFFHELSTQKGKFLILFEDIHWADEGTLDFIKFFARRISMLPCLFILTYRDDEIHSRHPLRNVLGQLPPDSFTKLAVPPLSKKAVVDMATQKGYNGEDVYSISGGNPFYVNEILASYSPGIPANIKDSILSVYERQEEGTKNAWQIFSVIPEGLEVERFAKIKSTADAAVDHCFAICVILVQNGKVIFKHELYRRTIEESLTPFRRIALNKLMLELFLEAFEEKGEIERILHYAKNANEKRLVVRYAPIAARKAASIGAHMEASKLFLTAIEYFQEDDADQLVKLYEAYAYECFLTNQVREAIIYQEKALKIWQAKKDINQIGNSLRFLSRVWWFEGNRREAEKYGDEAVRILQPQPSSKVKGMAFSNISQLKMLSDETAECIRWGNLAIEIAKEIDDDETRCHALNNIGTAHWQMDPFNDSANGLLMESLVIALKNSFHEHAARAYANMISNGIRFKNYGWAKKYLQDGLRYCEEMGLDSWTKYLLSWKARMLLETGDWDEAASLANILLANTAQPVIVKVGALVILATIKIRTGKTDASHHLEEAKTLAFVTTEHQRILPTAVACLEYEWLTAKKMLTGEELKVCIDLAERIDNIFLNSEFRFWLQKVRRQKIGLTKLYEPYRWVEEGKASASADFWERKGCPFDQALALSEGNDDNRRNALSIFQQLGADAVCEKIKMEMRAGGIKNIPRGLRESTKTNPARLTNRELDILRLLQQAIQNKEIADTLFISPKTVDHHISSILFKLDVNSRSKAVAEATRLGILK